MCACVYVCMCACVHVCMYVCMCVCVYVRMRVLCVYMSVCKLANTNTMYRPAKPESPHMPCSGMTVVGLDPPTPAINAEPAARTPS